MKSKSEQRKHLRKTWKKEWKLSLFLFLVGTAAGGFLYIQDWKNSKMPGGYYLERPAPGKENQEEELQVESLYGTRTIPITIEAQKLTREEIRKQLPEVGKQLEERILGENPSLEQIHLPLELVEELEGIPAVITWSVEEDGPIYPDGSLIQQNLPDEGILTELTARIQWEEEVLMWTICLHVYPPQLSQEEQFLESLQLAMDQEQRDSQYQTRITLPQQAAGMALQWSKALDFRGISIMLLAWIGAFLQLLAWWKDQEKQEQQRRLQIEMDYPEVVSKLKLYMEAGLACRTAWMRISETYQEKRREGQLSCRYLYEEMVKAGFEMLSGVSERNAYERFAERCRVPCCKKLTGLLIQNLRKGNKGLGELLEIEMWQAFENRKVLARKQGEEAGTKLLIPMIGMLTIVMVIVIAPALMSMQM